MREPRVHGSVRGALLLSIYCRFRRLDDKLMLDVHGIGYVRSTAIAFVDCSAAGCPRSLDSAWRVRVDGFVQLREVAAVLRVT